jgi:flagellar motor switch protein FliG
MTAQPGAAARAAIMVMLLDEEKAMQILGQLEPEELKTLGEHMCALDQIDPVAISSTVSDFLNRASQDGMPATDRARQVRTLMTGAVGEVKARNLMKAILPPAMQRHSSLELAKWLEPEVIVALMEDEHPQAIAVLLVQLDPQVAARVLHALPEDAQAKVVHRIARLNTVSSEANLLLEDLLAEKIASLQGIDAIALGGPADAAEIINKSAGVVEKRVMSQLARADRQLAKQIEAEMFRFEHVFVLDGQSMGTLLREVPSEVLVDALKGVAEGQRECFFAAMSSRAADGVRDEIEDRGRIKLAEVEAAQAEIIAIARRLAADGEIAFGSGGDDDYV